MLAGMWMQRDMVACIAGLSLLLFFVSAFDDLRPLSALLRLLVHLAAAILIVLLWVNAFALATLRPGASNDWTFYPLGAIVTVLAIVWMTNLFNFMDGADGLAGGASMIGFGTYALALVMQSNMESSIAVLVASLAGAAAGFLILNFPPAKVFMGDAGSIPLGFLAITLGIHGSMKGLWPLWFPGLVFSPFIVDATATLVHRTAQGHKPWIAHRDHYYQRLVLSGWSHRKTTLAYYFAMLATGGSALYSQRRDNAHFTLYAWVITYALLLLLLEWHLRQKKKKNSKNNDREKT
jgi:UDP-N-acetylmuramyl pentapeptide phosphotransferase/UDP-N-acetylglucosamine-1-phosphate transferase